MWDIKIFNLDFFHLFYYFIVFSFFGWIYESCWVSIRKKQWVNRGFLNGPIIPIYGAGASILHITFFQFRDIMNQIEPRLYRIIYIYIIGMLVATTLEYVTSYLMEIIFHASWWDYSDIRFNIKGRVCLRASLFWGFLSVMLIEVVQPTMIEFINDLKRPQFEYVGAALFFTVVMDFTYTTFHVLQLHQKLIHLDELRNELFEFIDNIKLYDNTEEIRTKYANLKTPEIIRNIKQTIESNKQKIKEKSQMFDELKNSTQLRSEMDRKLKILIQKYRLQTRENSVHQRLMKAYPNLKVKKYEIALKELREKIRKRKSDKK